MNNRAKIVLRSAHLVLEMAFCDFEKVLDMNSRTHPAASDDRKTLDSTDVGWFFAQILLSLKAIHALRITHFDLKPANFLYFADSGKLKLGDFGLARAMPADRSQISCDAVGTAHYIAPEMIYQKYSLTKSLCINWIAVPM